MENLLCNSRFLVIFTVIICIASAIILYIVGISMAVNIMLEIARQWPIQSSFAKTIAVYLLKTLDILLIAVTFQIIAIGLYRLFIKNDLVVPNVMQFDDFDKLKAVIIRLVIIVLMILFLEQAVEMGPSLEILFFGIAISAIMFVGIWAADKMSHVAD